MTVETYRNVKIERAVDVMLCQVRASDAFCISVRERAEDSAPLLDTFATVEEAREAIDEHLGETSHGHD